MIHKCPVCRYHPLGYKEREWYCPECGWKEEPPEETVMVLE